MQIFPMYEADVSPKKGSKASIPTLHIKLIKQSVLDQQYFLTSSELYCNKYRYIHKLMDYTTSLMKCIAREHFLIACLAITGLIQMIIKEIIVVQ
jgi:hypothetical protein